MRLGFVRAWNSIDGPVTNDEVADFVVLSGANGSGKSNLLEAIQNGSITVDGVATAQPGQPQPGVRLFSLAQLVITAEGAQPMASFRDRWIQLKQQVENISLQHSQQQGFPPGSDQLEDAVKTGLIQSRMVTVAGLSRMLTVAGKRLIDFTLYDYRTASPLLSGTGVRDAFTLTVGELFLTYHHRRTRNEFLQWREAQKADQVELPLTDEEFVLRYGPPPWDLLDEILQLLRLPYRFFPPQGVEEDLPYEPRLTHNQTGVAVTLAQLSSGEKTLMAIAMSLYTGTRLEHEIEMPRVLLLDEADASLHPSMVQSLLRVADEIFHQRYGVRVIMTTHSPSTVALAPDDAIYTMRRAEYPRLRHTSHDAAISDLVVGIPTLSVRNEHRRQVFVESEVDEACYQALFRHLRQELATELSLEFIAAGRGGSGGAEAVKHLVTSLRSAGNLAVRGIVDRDARAAAPEGIHYIADRYSLENLVLDPVLLGIFLIRERIVVPADMSLRDDLRHFEVRSDQVQTIADFVARELPALAIGERSTVQYIGGASATIPRAYLDGNGHELESAVTGAFPRLKSYRILKLTVIDAVVQDVPQFTPTDTIKLFEEVLAGQA